MFDGDFIDFLSMIISTIVSADDFNGEIFTNCWSIPESVLDFVVFLSLGVYLYALYLFISTCLSEHMYALYLYFFPYIGVVLDLFS